MEQFRENFEDEPLNSQESFWLKMGKQALAWVTKQERVKSLVAGFTEHIFDQSAGYTTISFAVEKDGKRDFMRVVVDNAILDDEKFVELLDQYKISINSLKQETNLILDDVFSTSSKYALGSGK